MIRGAHELTGLPVALLTNGSLLCHLDVRAEVSAAQAVLPSLDAGTPELHRRINRPHPAISFADHVAGLAALRREYSGKLWLEVMLVAGLNDTPQALADIAAASRRIEPDEIHINSPTRAPVEPWVEPADHSGVMRAATLFAEIAPVRIAAASGEQFAVTTTDSILDGIIDIITRHPMSQEQLEATLLRRAPQDVGRLLARLANSSRVRMIVRGGKRFWAGSRAYFPELSDA
jgi:wyosine [tRNA(Phe)-imidazoG37] synthetase (radical SAM superfamily)